MTIKIVKIHLIIPKIIQLNDIYLLIKQTNCPSIDSNLIKLKLLK